MTEKIYVTCLQIVTLKMLLTVCYVADCYMIGHLPGLFFDFIVKKYEI